MDLPSSTELQSCGELVGKAREVRLRTKPPSPSFRTLGVTHHMRRYARRDTIQGLDDEVSVGSALTKLIFFAEEMGDTLGIATSAGRPVPVIWPVVGLSARGDRSTSLRRRGRCTDRLGDSSHLEESVVGARSWVSGNSLGRRVCAQRST